MGFQHLGIEDFYIISLFPGVVFSSKAAIKKNGNDSICLICGKDDETVEHFILQCPALSVVRDPVITEISFILYEHYRITVDTFNIQKKRRLWIPL
jgi:hypothetical protein